jgi:putative membrane protein
MPTLKTLLLAAAALPLMGLGAAQAADAPRTQNQPATKSQAAPMKVSTADYVKKAAIGDMFEIESSKLAAEKATDKRLKNFAQKMVKDHGNSSEKLKATLSKAKVNEPLPTELDAEHKQTLDKLRAASGAEYDRMYFEEQLKGHREALALHDGYAKSGDNAELKKTAGDITKVVQSHIKELEDIQKDNAKRNASSSRGVDPAAPPDRKAAPAAPTAPTRP